MDRKQGGAKSWSGHSDEEKNSHPLPGLEPLIIQPIAQCNTTELSWLLVFCVGLQIKVSVLTDGHLKPFKFQFH
jgi:hypothetical protein